MKRLAIIAPDTTTAKSVVEILHKEDVPKKDISVIAKKREDTSEELEATEVLGGSAIGTMLGGSTLTTLGTLVGLPVFVFAGGILIATSAVLGAATLACGLTAWLLDTLGDNSDKKRVEDYRAAVEEGEILIIANIPDEKLETLAEQVYEKNLNLKVESLPEPAKVGIGRSSKL